MAVSAWHRCTSCCFVVHARQRRDYGKITLLYRARSPVDMAFNYELQSWLEREDIETHLTIDAKYAGWYQQTLQYRLKLCVHGRTGFYCRPAQRTTQRVVVLYYCRDMMKNFFNNNY